MSNELAYRKRDRQQHHQIAEQRGNLFEPGSALLLGNFSGLDCLPDSTRPKLGKIGADCKPDRILDQPANQLAGGNIP